MNNEKINDSTLKKPTNHAAFNKINKNVVQNENKLYDVIPTLKPGYYFIPLGGTDMIGMNFNVFGIVTETSESWMICDIGISILNERGLKVELASPHALINKHIDGIVITHAHDDHIAGIIYVLDLFKNKHIPIYATKFALSVMNFKLQKFTSLDRRLKSILKDSDAEQIYAKYRNNFDLIEVAPNESFALGLFRITLLYITHSTIESNMIRIEFGTNGKTFDYTLLHTADWKNDCTPVIGDPANLELIKKNCKKINMILCDSTNSVKPGSTPSEASVEIYLNRLLRKYSTTTRVLISFFSTNVARIKTVLSLAKQTQRQIVIYGTSMIELFKIATEHGYITQQEYDSVLMGIDITNKKNERLLILCTGSQAEPTSVLSKLANDKFKYMKLHDNIVYKQDVKNVTVIIFASSIIPGNENNISDLKNRLLKKGAIIVDTTNDGIFLNETLKNDIYTSTQNGDSGNLHVSGHPSRDDIKHLIKVMQPDAIIPVHGSPLHLVALRDLAKSIDIRMPVEIPFDGCIVKLNGKMGENSKWIPIILNESIEPLRLYLDGTSIISSASPHLKVRSTLESHGAIFIIINADTYEILSISNVGAIPIEYHYELNKLIYSIVSNPGLSTSIELLKKNLRDSIYGRFGKEPYFDIVAI